MNSKVLIVLIIFGCCGLGTGYAQSAVLDQYVQTALQNNLSVKNEQLRRNKQLVLIEQANKNWIPSVDVNANYIFSQGGRTILFPIGDLFNPIYGALNDLTQPGQFPTDLENQKIALTPNNFLDVQLSITQPLVNSSIRYNQKIQNALLRINEVDLELQKKAIAFQTKTAYYNYLKTVEGFRILDETKVLLLELKDINKKLVKYDKATREVVADVNFQLANLESEYSRLQSQQISAQAYFNLLLNQDLDTEINVDNDILDNFKFSTTSLEPLRKIARQQRSEFKKIDAATGVNELNRERIDKEKLPTLGVSANVGVQTENYDFDSGGPIYTLALGSSVNLFDGGRRKKRMEAIEVEQLLLQNNRAQLQQQIDLQVTQSFWDLKSIEQRLLAEQAAARSAQQSYDIIKSKYENEKAILLQLTDAQNKLVTSKLRQTLTKYDYLLKLAELDFATQ
jgi:outer membrane protein TolC